MTLLLKQISETTFCKQLGKFVKGRALTFLVYIGKAPSEGALNDDLPTNREIVGALSS